MKITPWKRIGRPSVIAEGYGKHLDEQRFLDHHGRESKFFFIEQPDWVVVLAVTENNRVLLVREYKQGADEVIEELPGGMANFPGEPLEKVALRELKEETGYRPRKIENLGSGFMNSRNSSTKFHCFLALDCKKISEPKLDDSEQMELIEMPLNDWTDFMIKGGTYQCDSYLAFLKALPFLGKKLAVERSDVKTS